MSISPINPKFFGNPEKESTNSSNTTPLLTSNHLILSDTNMVYSSQNDVVSSDTGHARLHQLGYKQELKRDLS